jgi:hypothetical protein
MHRSKESDYKYFGPEYNVIYKILAPFAGNSPFQIISSVNIAMKISKPIKANSIVHGQYLTTNAYGHS